MLQRFKELSVCIFLFFCPFALTQANLFEEDLPEAGRLTAAHVVSFVTKNVTPVYTGQNSFLSFQILLNTRNDFKIYTKDFYFYLESQGKKRPLEYVSSVAPTRIQDPWYEEERDVYFSNTLFTVLVPEQNVYELRVSFQACSNEKCFLPVTYEVSNNVGLFARLQEKGRDGIAAAFVSSSQRTSTNYDITSENNGAPDLILNKNPIASTISQVQEVRQGALERWTGASIQFVHDSILTKSIWLFPALLLAGLLVNFTPCVYPMIPITINVMHSFSGKSSNKLLLPFIYVTGVVLTYTVMGVFAALSGSLFGSLLQNSWVNLGLAFLFLYLGLVMLGYLNLNWVQTLGNKLPMNKKHPIIGVFSMGMVSGLVSAPCTGPVLSTILLVISQTKDPIYGSTLMLFFSMGFGLPYVFLGALSTMGGIKKMPKAPFLINGVKYLFAGLIFGLALYYLRMHIPDGYLSLILFTKPSLQTVVLFVAFALSAIILTTRKPWLKIRVDVILIPFLSLLGLWVSLLLTNGFYAKNVSKSRVEKADGLGWIKDWDEAKNRARTQNKPLIVDAWAEWCAACLKMDAELWADPEIYTILKESFVLAKLDFTHDTTKYQNIVDTWQIVGLPAVGFFKVNADFDQVPDIIFRSEISKSQLIDALGRLKE